MTDARESLSPSKPPISEVKFEGLALEKATNNDLVSDKVNLYYWLKLYLRLFVICIFLKDEFLVVDDFIIIFLESGVMLLM